MDAFEKCEEWRPVRGLEGMYAVSSLGRVRSVRYKRLLKTSPKGDGYYRVCLSNRGERKDILVHRMVAEAFIPKRNGADTVNHKDLNKTNNEVSNLEWMTPLENYKHAVLAGALPQQHKMAVNADSIAADYMAGMTQYQIADKYGVTQSAVSRAVGQVNRRLLWVVEMLHGDRWESTVVVAVNRVDGRRELAEWKRDNPLGRFRLVQYAPKSGSAILAEADK